jgi:hypothetical protein
VATAAVVAGAAVEGGAGAVDTAAVVAEDSELSSPHALRRIVTATTRATTTLTEVDMTSPFG